MVPLTQNWEGVASCFSSERGTAIPEVVTVDGRSLRRDAELLCCSISPHKVGITGKAGEHSLRVYKRRARRGLGEWLGWFQMTLQWSVLSKGTE